MPIIKSAIKKMRRDRRRTTINQRVRQEIKMVVKKMRRSPSKSIFLKASQILDRAAKRRIIHKNKASRLKSRLAKLLQKTKKKPTRKKKKS